MKDLSELLGRFSYIPVICGPTASGKSDLAMKVCEACGGELVSCDSMQIYRGLDIGTAKPTAEDQARVVHHMIDIVDPDENYSVNDYIRDALVAVASVLDKGKLPVLCGGTGQYVTALIKGLDLGSDDIDQSIIDTLYERFDEEGIDGIYSDLAAVDKEAADKIHPNNTRRVIRAYAVYLGTGKTFTQKNRESTASGPAYPYKLFQPDLRRDVLYERINNRVDKMIDSGLVAEAEWLYKSYSRRDTTAFQAIGYKELFPYINGDISLDKAVYNIKLGSRHYAKRQLTWFRGMPEINMISTDNYKSYREVLDAVT